MGQTSQSDPLPQGEGLPPAPPAPPRALSRSVLRRAWMEHRVRRWWLMGAMVLATVIYYGGSRWYLWSREKFLIRHGVRVEAEVMGWNPNEDAPKKNMVLPPNASVDLLYSYNGRTYRPHGGLGGRKEQIFTHTLVPIYIDPSDPARWTARTEVPVLMDLLLGAMLLAPISCVLFAIAIIQRRRVARIWRDGTAFCAEVLEVRQSATAPRSRVLSCAVEDGDHTSAVQVVVPANKAPGPGGLVWLIAPEGKPSLAIPAALFE